MRIGLLTSIGRTLDAFFVEIVGEWSAAGHAVFCAAGTATSRLRSTILPSLSRKPSWKTIRAAGEINKWALAHKLDVIVTNTATASMAARMRRRSFPIIYFCHGLHWNRQSAIKDKAFDLAETILLSRTDGVITINSDDEEWFKNRTDSIPVFRSQFGVGVPLAEYPWCEIKPQANPSLLWAGEFSPRKRPFSAIHIARKIADLMNGDIQLTMIGAGELKVEAQRLVHDLGLSGIVSIPGRRPFAQMISEHTALLHTAEWEGLPRVMLEALAMGRQSFAYDVKGVRDIPYAVLVDDGDVEELARMCTAYLTSPNRTAITESDIRSLDTHIVATDLRQFVESVVASGK